MMNHFILISCIVSALVVGVLISVIFAHVRNLKINWCFFMHKWDKPEQVDSIYVETKRRCIRCKSVQAKLFSGKSFTITRKGIDINK